MVLVELLELLTQLLYFFLVGHFHEHVEGCSFELTGSSEGLESFKDAVVHFDSSHLVSNSEPLMLQSLVGIESLIRIDHQKALDEIND